jgi:hypothetical protein
MRAKPFDLSFHVLFPPCMCLPQIRAHLHNRVNVLSGFTGSVTSGSRLLFETVDLRHAEAPVIATPNERPHVLGGAQAW